MTISSYYDRENVRASVLAGAHRELVGGLWEEIGRLTVDFLVKRGVEPHHTVLDIGCGCLRVGVHLVAYSEPGRYFGLDISQELLDAGYDKELGALELQPKLPRENLLCDGEFSFDRFRSAPSFDVAVAQSLFTHLPLNHVRLCMEKLSLVTEPGARCFATVFLVRKGQRWVDEIRHEPGGIVTYPARDPYHYRLSDLADCLRGLPWEVAEPEHWGHPRGQWMVIFTRV